MTKPKSDEDQSRRFIDKARELGCDEDPKTFGRMFSKVVPPKKARADAAPKGRQRPKPKKRSA